jgi:hypothetical protein
MIIAISQIEVNLIVHVLIILVLLIVSLAIMIFTLVWLFLCLNFGCSRLSLNFVGSGFCNAVVLGIPGKESALWYLEPKLQVKKRNMLSGTERTHKSAKRSSSKLSGSVILQSKAVDVICSDYSNVADSAIRKGGDVR